MSAAAVKAIEDLIEIGTRLSRLNKEDDAWDLTPAQAGELLRAVELVSSALSGALDSTYVTEQTAHGRTQRSFAAGTQAAKYLRGVMAEAHRSRGR